MTELRTVNIDADGDIEVVNGKTSIVSGADAAIVIINGKLTTLLGEWFLDLASEGLPMWQHFLVANPNPHQMQDDIRERIEQVPGVTDVVVDLNVEESDPRTLIVEWSGYFDGTPIEGTERLE